MRPLIRLNKEQHLPFKNGLLTTLKHKVHSELWVPMRFRTRFMLRDTIHRYCKQVESPEEAVT